MWVRHTRIICFINVRVTWEALTMQLHCQRGVVRHPCVCAHDNVEIAKGCCVCVQEYTDNAHWQGLPEYMRPTQMLGNKLVTIRVAHARHE